MNKFISYLFFFLINFQLVGYAQDSLLISKKMKQAKFWLSSSRFQALNKFACKAYVRQLPVDSFKVLYHEALNNYAGELDSLEYEDKKNRTTFTLSNSFTTNVNYKGRIIGDNQLGNVVSVLVETPFGLNFYVAENYWSYEIKPLALTELGVGYENDFLDYFTIGVDYEKWKFANGSKKERNYLRNFVAGYLVFESDHIYANAMYSYAWGRARASAVNLDLAFIKKINFVSKLKYIEFKPTFTFIAGNPNYTLRNFKSGIKGSKSQVSSDQNYFTVLDYETSLAISTSWHKFKLIAEQHFAFPINGTLDEPIRNFSYFTLQLDFIFGVKCRNTSRITHPLPI